MSPDEDPAVIREQYEAARRAKIAEENAAFAENAKRQMKATPLHNRPKEDRRGPGCGLFMVVALAWCFVACGPSRQFKDQAADVLDVARQLHWSGCEEKHPYISSLDIDPNGPPIEAEMFPLLQQDLCDKAYYTLVSVEPGLEDEIAKKRRLQAMWDTLEPVVWPYIQDKTLTAAQLLLAYVTGNILGQALETVSKPP